MRNLACGDLTRTEDFMLRKLLINDWVPVSSELVFEDRGRMVKWHVPIWGDCWERFKYGKMG